MPSRRLPSLLFLAALALVQLTARRPGHALVPLDELPLRTQGRHIVGAAGERVKWACVNWYGAHSETYVVGGLQVRRLEEIVATLRALPFNCVRLTYSTKAHVDNPVVMDSAVIANPHFRGKRFLDVWDATVHAITKAGLIIIVNNQVHKAGWCCHYTQAEGLWYLPDYSERLWIESLVNMTVRHRGNPLVVGIDLRNELHDYRGTMLTWGDSNPTTDWLAAAEKAGNACLQANPDILVVVEALCFGFELRPVRDVRPVNLAVPGRLVYTVHNYLEFQVFYLVDKFLPWAEIRCACLCSGAASALALVFVVARWRALGSAGPSKATAVVTLGSWLCALALLAAAAFEVLFEVLAHGVPACGYWAYRDAIPARRLSLVLAAAGASLAAGGILCHRAPATPGHEASDETELVATPTDSGPRVPLSAFESSSRPGVKPGACCQLQCVVCLSVLLLLLGTLYWYASVALDYSTLEASLDRSWGFALEDGQAYTAPVWLGEFGHYRADTYWNNLIRYIKEHDLDYAYWALNGLKYSTGHIDGSTGAWVDYPAARYDEESFGILNSDFKTVRHKEIVDDLAHLHY